MVRQRLARRPRARAANWMCPADLPCLFFRARPHRAHTPFSFSRTRRRRKRWSETRERVGWKNGEWKRGWKGLSETLGPTTNATAPLSFYNRKAHISQPVSPHAWFPVATPFSLAPFPLSPLTSSANPLRHSRVSFPRFPRRRQLSLCVLHFPSSDLPPPRRRVTPGGERRVRAEPAGGGRQIAGRRSARGIVMKTYEIYSIWADAITPADRGGGQPSSSSFSSAAGQPPAHPPFSSARGYTCTRTRGMRACVCVWYEVWRIASSSSSSFWRSRARSFDRCCCGRKLLCR